MPLRQQFDWHIHVCPYCGQQYRGPGGHHVAGDDAATGCFHAHPGEQGVVQPKLVRVRVVPAEPFELKPIPHDQPIMTKDPRDSASPDSVQARRRDTDRHLAQ